MYEAYKNIFDRVGLTYKIVTADTGVMGGLLSEESPDSYPRRMEKNAPVADKPEHYKMVMPAAYK